MNFTCRFCFFPCNFFYSWILLLNFIYIVCNSIARYMHKVKCFLCDCMFLVKWGIFTFEKWEEQLPCINIIFSLRLFCDDYNLKNSVKDIKTLHCIYLLMIKSDRLLMLTATVRWLHIQAAPHIQSRVWLFSGGT